MVLFIVALMVLVAVGVLLWKAVAAQALATGTGTTEDDAPTGPTRPPFGGGRARRSRPVAPDDDPEFLRSLDDQMRRPDRDDPPTA